MVTTTHWARLTQVRRLVCAAVFAAAVALPGSAIGVAVIANAEPDNDGSWDIKAFNDCIQNTTKPTWRCCIESGGVPSAPADLNICTAPRAKPATLVQSPRGRPL
ncbi:hypothetical protein M2272_000377 [Mycobacterium frederiksbergense]|uniref:Uncharacterized protein n=1 Tax=Mycolicibacterium frederiksbergense TaxID=117567 RepID=A0ABT6KU18_9MYCO|nr:hypothetical protein [Mycolicibacterium frederiksbergense]MDH6193756.1 hypothetical protein [Mycolicibacterium frederiksbergense]